MQKCTSDRQALPHSARNLASQAITHAAEANALQHFIGTFGLSAPDAEALADPDFDGILNLNEYALLLAPNVPSVAGLPVIAIKNYAGTNYTAQLLAWDVKTF